MRRVAWLLFFLGLVPASADDLPYPSGRSEHELEGLKTALLVPYEIGEGKKLSLVVLLHGAGDSGPNLIGAMSDWAGEDYVICAPSAPAGTWSAPDLKKSLKIAAHLKKVMPIDPERVHVVGFSNGGWNLTPLAFDDDLKPRSAVWIAAGFRGGKAPKWAKKGLGVLALAGEQDPNAGAARATVTALQGKVRCVEVRLQPDLGHKWPRLLIPYALWWMGVQEGRYEPGEDRNFEWLEDLDEAIASQKDKKRGGVLVYVFSKEDKDPSVQNEVLMDPLVRWYGGQIAAVKLEKGDEDETWGVKSTPALAVLDKAGACKKVFSGKIKAKSVASALRSVAPDRKKPK